MGIEKNPSPSSDSAMEKNYHLFKTTQNGPHKNLSAIIRRHKPGSFKRPIPHHQHAAFSSLHSFVTKENKPIIIDSCCGTGLSSIKLAQQFPDHVVIGIDKSLDRLNRSVFYEGNNLLLLRANVIDQWRLLKEAQLPITHHFLFFPNPWPKATQLKRRFHAHPVFYEMAMLAPYFEMRTNWKIYGEECQIAFRELGLKTSLELKQDTHYYSLFEKKYLSSACPIFIVKTQND